MGSRLSRFLRHLSGPAALLAAAVLLLFPCIRAGADPAWPENTVGQMKLKAYVETANAFLREQGETAVNSLFEAYAGFAVFGITDQPDEMTPEGVEITAQLFQEDINTLQLRVSYIPRFSQIAAAFIRALNPDGMTTAEAKETPEKWAKKALKNPEDSFEEEVEELNGTMPRIYYAYYPNQYHDGVSWIQMTIVFPLAGIWDGEGIDDAETATRAPDTYSGYAENYEGYFSEDDYSHYEFFTTPTPEPDSAAVDGFPTRSGGR